MDGGHGGMNSNCTRGVKCLRRIFDITWQDKVPNRVVLDRAGIFSMYTLLKQQHLRWLGHVVRMADGWIPKDLL